jgi:hypothetical protein
MIKWLGENGRELVGTNKARFTPKMRSRGENLSKAMAHPAFQLDSLWM